MGPRYFFLQDLARREQLVLVQTSR
jgi:hypothetical protein